MLQALNKNQTLKKFSPKDKSENNIQWIHPTICAGTGFPSPADDYIDHPLDWNDFLVQHPSATFTVRVIGDSMSPQIPEGAFVIVDKSLSAKNGDIVVAVVNGEFTLKQFSKQKKEVQLVPFNTTYPTMSIKGEDDFNIWGVVTASVEKYR